MRIRSTLALNLDRNILHAALPLLAADKVQAMEWSFDSLYGIRDTPSWFTDFIHEFSRSERLIGHGVFFSMFSGKWMKEQAAWLDDLRAKCAQFHFDHITEHFGFMTGPEFRKGAPLGVPMTDAILKLGRDRLQRIADACQRPVGLENLAFAHSTEEARRHAEFLERLLEPVNGFLLLDLHNLYCHLHNFHLNADEIIAAYPLDRVREIHISGGSWAKSKVAPEGAVRRDTHDGRVPERVFQLLEEILPRCPRVKYVVLEHLGGALQTEESQAAYREDYLRMDGLVQSLPVAEGTDEEHAFAPILSLPPGQPVEDMDLLDQQLTLSRILESSCDQLEAQERLGQSALARTAWNVECWPPHMVETAMQLAKKWKDGFSAQGA